MYGFVVDTEHSFCYFHTGKYSEGELSYVGMTQESFYDGVVVCLKKFLEFFGLDEGENADFGAAANRINYDAIFIVAKDDKTMFEALFEKP